MKLRYLVLLFISLTVINSQDIHQQSQEEPLGYKTSDLDQDGYISLQEFQIYYQPYKSEMSEDDWQESKMDYYLSFDMDGDEMVTVQEFEIVHEGDDNFAEPGYIEQNYYEEGIDLETIKRRWWLQGQMSTQNLQYSDSQTINIQMGEDGQYMIPQGLDIDIEQEPKQAESDL